MSGLIPSRKTFISGTQRDIYHLETSSLRPTWCVGSREVPVPGEGASCGAGSCLTPRGGWTGFPRGRVHSRNIHVIRPNHELADTIYGRTVEEDEVLVAVKVVISVLVAVAVEVSV